MKKKVVCALVAVVVFIAGIGVGCLTSRIDRCHEEIDYNPNVPVAEILHYESVAAVDIYGNEWVIDVNLVSVEEVEDLTVAEMLE